MKLAIKIVLVAAGLATVPAAAAILGSATFFSSRGSTGPDTQRIGMPVHPARGLATVTEEGGRNVFDTLSDAMIEFAQAMGQPWDRPGAGAPGALPVQYGPPIADAPGLSGPLGRFGFGRPPGPLPSPRNACEERVNRLMAVTAYLKSKMHLQAEQKIAWQKIEQAAEPNVEKIRDLCGQLPSQTAQPPNVLELVDLGAKHMAARAELLHAVQAPLQALYETLTPDQRAILAIAPPAFPPMAPVPPGSPMMPPHTQSGP
jgi:LTXXQ motif family protein